MRTLSKYTTEVRYICESFNSNTNSVSSTIDETIENARLQIFNFDYPYYDEEQKKRFETQFLRHYYFREIGFEVFGLWQSYLCSTLRDIMPYYLQMYKSAALNFDPFNDTNTQRNINNTKENNRTKNNTVETNISESIDTNKTITENSTANNISNNGESDTPQGSLDNVKNFKYLTKAGRNESDLIQETNNTDIEKIARKNDENRTGNETENNKENGTVVETVTGKQSSQSYSSLLLEYRKTFINIDLMIIEELNDLFMNIY